MRLAKSARCCLVAMLGLVFIVVPIAPAAPEEPYKAQIDALRKAMEKGEKMAGYMHYPRGAMGIHFVNLTIQGAPDPMKPNILIYEPVGKELRLVAVEWLVPLTADAKQRPSLFGQ